VFMGSGFALAEEGKCLDFLIFSNYLPENYSSYSGYGKIGFDRRFRIYDISDFGETIRTYKRTEKDEVLDEMILAGKNSPPLS
jgi:hypothetical protein